MRADKIGVIIARGDLAVKCGWERLADLHAKFESNQPLEKLAG